MEQCSPPFGWIYYNEDEIMMSEMRQYILQSRMELEATLIAAQEEIMKKEEEVMNIKDLLIITIKERDEAQSKLQNLIMENLILQHKLQTLPEKPSSLSNTTSSESEESSMISSPPLPMPANSRPLPEKGKLLKAVMEAGPLLQTLLLAGPLPQWQHPPPQLESVEIPPVNVNSKKRGLNDFDCSIISSPKYQRVV
ncbi:uncharacterized protein LOC130797705 [Amaranthus tricolor]|uniref:uncharacterized protein LOC130797705 n=1 Tax=Amaranthus tricolor TaxID=29722 RepID=UPI00258DE42E|nr:uncharacterized protein LOC130797705 [Amaranthus tricolor]